jgi:hypothetical protein
MGFLKLGGVPRILLKDLFKLKEDGWAKSVAHRERYIAEQAMSLINKNPQVTNATSDSGLFKERASHSVIAVRPAAPDGSPTVGGMTKRPVNTEYEKSIVTIYVAQLLALEVLKHHTAYTRTIYESLAGYPLLRTSAGYIFEEMTHRSIVRRLQISTGTVVSNSAVSIPKTKRVTKEVRFNSLVDLGCAIGDSPGSQNVKEEYIDTYLRPRSSNLASVDSFMICKFKKKLLTLMFQITIGKQHTVKTSGLDAIYNILPHLARSQTMGLVFVIPDNEPDFSEQEFEGSDVSVALWRSRTQQSVWRMTNKDLWGATHN